MQDQKLMDCFKFDEADLESNRMGQFTTKQKTRLVKENKQEKTQGWFVGGFFILIALGSLVFAIYKVAMTFDWGNRILLGLGFGCILPLVSAFVAYGFLSVALGKLQVKLQRAEGLVNIVKKDYSGAHGHTYHEHELHIGGKKFDVDKNLADVMMQGDTYAIYYAKGSEDDDDDLSQDDILSAELISKAK
jgi:hypothetical protein